jgi:5-methylcytosine-specific restriction protein A
LEAPAVRRPKVFRPSGRPTGIQAERQRDRDRRTAFATRKLYATPQWHALRDEQLSEEPFCRYCLEADVTTLATVCDHVHPHGGDVDKFWRGPFQSLCKDCHDGRKQREEAADRGRGGVNL